MSHTQNKGMGSPLIISLEEIWGTTSPPAHVSSITLLEQAKQSEGSESQLLIPLDSFEGSMELSCMEVPSFSYEPTSVDLSDNILCQQLIEEQVNALVDKLTDYYEALKTKAEGYVSRFARKKMIREIEELLKVLEAEMNRVLRNCSRLRKLKSKEKVITQFNAITLEYKLIYNKLALLCKKRWKHHVGVCQRNGYSLDYDIASQEVNEVGEEAETQDLSDTSEDAPIEEESQEDDQLNQEEEEVEVPSLPIIVGGKRKVSRRTGSALASFLNGN